MFRVQAGIDLLHVPYKSIAPALPLVRSAKPRALGVTSARRTPQAPKLLALAETLPGFQFAGWYGLAVPAGTPRDVITRIH